MDPDSEFWYQQHTLDSDTHHLNNHMIEMIQKYMRGDATRMETYIDLGAVVYEFKHCKGIFARSKSTMVRYEYINNLDNLSTDIVRMHMDPDSEFWYQQHTLDSDTHHLNNHMIEMIQKYMRGDATRMETYIDLGAVVYEFKHCKGIFARSKSTMEDIRSMHADFYNLPDKSRYNTSADSSNKNKYWRKRSPSMIASNYSRQSLASHRF
jgi:hypothetical protein